MPRNSEFTSYVFIRNDLQRLGWNTRNPSRDARGQVYTQQECLDHPELAAGLGSQRPEYVLKINEESFWVVEAKSSPNEIDRALSEAVNYARDINKPKLVSAIVATGVAGNDADGYITQTVFVCSSGSTADITYNGKPITGLLSPDQARQLVNEDTHELNTLVTDEKLLLSIAEQINEELHKASINKDRRATVMSAVLLSMVSDTLPNFNASADVFIKDINNRAEDVLIYHSKRELYDHIEIKPPEQPAAKDKFKASIVKVLFLLRRINIRAAMDGKDDLLGKFYEVFLKYGNGAKDIGIVLTPRHIAEFSAKILDIKASDLVYDPACGTGGFLVAAYDLVRNREPDYIEMFKKHRIFGVEQQANVASLAIVNMIFRGDGKNNIINNDCLTLNLERIIRNKEHTAGYVENEADRKAVNKVLMNPPFALKRGDEQETTFVDHALRQMTNEALLLTVLPVSVMYAGGREQTWRERILQGHSFVAVISLNNELFYPQAAVEPLLVVIRKGVPQASSPECLFVRVSDDGYRKSKRRRLPHGGTNDLDRVEEALQTFIATGSCNEISGLAEARKIKVDAAALDITPQWYLPSPAPDSAAIAAEMRRLHIEAVLEATKRDMLG